MSKSLLKSSVSALVLFGMLAATPSSYAGNNSSGEQREDNQGKKSIKKAPPRKETQPANSQLNFEEYAQGQIGLTNINHQPQFLPAELIQRILMHRGIDSETLLNSVLVCKSWYSLAHGGKQHILDVLQDPTKQLNLLDNFLFHPSAFRLGYQTLSKDFPHQLIYVTDTQKPKKGKTTTTTLTTLPNNIVGFANVVHKMPHIHRPLCESFVELSPFRDYKSVAFAAHLAQFSPNLGDALWEITKNHEFEISLFLDLITDTNNYPILQKHLTGLKILALSGSQEAKGRMDEFDGVISGYLSGTHVPGYLHSMQIIHQCDEFIAKNSHFLNYPFWGAYTINTNNDSVLFKQIMGLANLMNGQYGASLDLSSLSLFADYAFEVAPHLKNQGLLNHFYDALRNLESLKKGDNTISTQKQYEAIDKQYEEADTDNLADLVAYGGDYAAGGKYDKAMTIYKEQLEKVGDSPFRFQILNQMAECILASQDMVNLPQARAYLQTIWDEFERTGAQELDTSFVKTIGEGDEKKTINESDELLIQDVLALMVAVQIYEGKFKEAYKLLKDTELTSHCDLEMSPGLMKAVTTQAHRLPTNLLNLFKKELTRFSSKRMEMPEMQKFIADNEELYKAIHKGHPIDKRKWEKQQKKIRSKFQPDEATPEKTDEKAPEKTDEKVDKKIKQEKEEESSSIVESTSSEESVEIEKEKNRKKEKKDKQ